MRDLRVSDDLRYLGHVNPSESLIADELTVGLWPLGEEEGSVIARDASVHGRPLEGRGSEWGLCPPNF
jgi:hypothetical protein